MGKVAQIWLFCIWIKCKDKYCTEIFGVNIAAGKNVTKVVFSLYQGKFKKKHYVCIFHDNYDVTGWWLVTIKVCVGLWKNWGTVSENCSLGRIQDHSNCTKGAFRLSDGTVWMTEDDPELTVFTDSPAYFQNSPVAVWDLTFKRVDPQGSPSKNPSEQPFENPSEQPFVNPSEQPLENHQTLPWAFRRLLWDSLGAFRLLPWDSLGAFRLLP